MARAVAGFASASAGVDEALRGDFDRGGPLPFAPALKKGEAVRLAFAGVPVREGGLLGRLIAGLSHEEKKSSEGSPAGVFAPSGVLSSAMSATDTSSGNLELHQIRFRNTTSRSNSQSLICRNSSLKLFLILGCRIRGVFYFRVFARKCSRAAMGLEVFGSRLIATNLHYPQLIPLPYYVAVSIKRCRGCLCPPYCLDSSIVQRRYARPDYDGSPSSQGRDRYQTEQRSMLDFWRCSRSKSAMRCYSGYLLDAASRSKLYLIRGLGLQFLKDLDRLALGS